MKECSCCKRKFYERGGVLLYHLRLRKTLYFCSMACAELIMHSWKAELKEATERKTEGGIPPVDKSTGILPTIL